MKLDYQKELTPVLYGDGSVKILFIDHLPYSQSFPTHWHERMEILYVTKGKLYYKTGDMEYCAKAGELAIFSPQMPHTAYTKESSVEYTVIMFDISRFFNSTVINSKLLSPLYSQQIVFSPHSSSPELSRCVEEIIRLHEEAENLLAVAAVYSFLAMLYKHCPLEETLFFSETDKFKNIISFVNENFAENISSASLSRKFGYDEAYLCRRFKKITGFSPMEYIRISRLENARKLLKQGKLDISEISEVCGFSTSGYFSRCFKRYYGFTPTEYKKSFT